MIDFRFPDSITVDLAQAKSILQSISADPMGGWFDLPLHPDSSELIAIKSAAAEIQSNSDYLVCIGIGGSYLGHRAVAEALSPQGKTKLLYAGNSLSPLDLSDLLATLGDADFSINVISKSGTTLEPALAFRLLKAKLMAKYGESYRDRIYATTDASSGALHDEAVAEGYRRFVVPSNLGGRYSVLSAVGLLPLAAAGVDLDALLSGAAAEREHYDPASDGLTSTSVVRYAFLRASLAKRDFDVEVLGCFEPRLHYFAEWWKQLFGESEGKQHQGIFPAATIYTTDLHSLGQYLQEGRRNIFETMLEFANFSATDFQIPATSSNLDGLNYLADRHLSQINRTALEATVAAHRTGGIPVAEIIAPDLSAASLGALIFFFELSCALSAHLSGVNPFDQPGVEAYKQNIFKLLGKPGF